MLARIRKSKEQEGFTLIELLVVIIIIGILAAIAIPVFLNQRKKGVDAGVKSDIRQVANEMESFFTDSQTYPTSLNVELTGSNVLQVVPKTDGTAYCVQGYNAKGTKSSSAAQYVYRSDAGGLQAASVNTCDTGVYDGTAFTVS